MHRAAWLTILCVLFAGCASADSAGPAGGLDQVQQLLVEVLATHPHDPQAFTQGLELADGLLYESTGRYGRSDIRVSEVQTGRVQQREPLPEEYFGEGLTLVGDQIWQLTWQEQVALRRDRDTLAERERVPYEGEGWGLCYDQTADRLVMSDGTPQLTFRDPQTFAVRATVMVSDQGRPLEMINELECVDGKVWANVWQTDRIVRIDPDAGRVEAVVDASGLLPDEDAGEADVLNGIAAVPDSDTFLITGKLWPTVFHVRFIPE